VGPNNPPMSLYMRPGSKTSLWLDRRRTLKHARLFTPRFSWRVIVVHPFSSYLYLTSILLIVHFTTGYLIQDSYPPPTRLSVAHANIITGHRFALAWALMTVKPRAIAGCSSFRHLPVGRHHPILTLRTPLNATSLDFKFQQSSS